MIADRLLRLAAALSGGGGHRRAAGGQDDPDARHLPGSSLRLAWTFPRRPIRRSATRTCSCTTIRRRCSSTRCSTPPALFRHLKAAIDDRRHDMGRYILTGSQNFTLMKGISDSLAGRCGIVELETLALHEIDAVNPLPVTTRPASPD